LGCRAPPEPDKAGLLNGMSRAEFHEYKAAKSFCQKQTTLQPTLQTTMQYDISQYLIQ
jgi:hypothetical protein